MEMAMAMAMDGGEDAASWWKLMVMETAKKELEMLESNHPNQFEFFKAELKSFIPLQNDLPTSSIATQASTSATKRKMDDEVALHRRHQQRRRHSTSTVASQDSTSGMMERRRRRRSCLVKGKREKVKEDESVEVALERAKACLQKIHDLKTQLLIC